MIYLFYFVLIIIVVSGLYIAIRLKNKNLKRAGFLGSIIASSLLLFEMGALLIFYFQTNHWLYFEKENRNNELFEPHPYMIGMNRKDISKKFNGYQFSHNSDGFRGEEVPLKSDKIRIVTIGASTTYGVGVNDWETWPYYLDSLLGDKYEVINMGTPGHSTVEHIIFSSLWLSEYDADIVMIHTGLNDLRSSNVDDLLPDFSNFHAPTLFGSLGLCFEENIPKLAMLRAGVIFLQKLKWIPICSNSLANVSGKESIDVDERLAYLYQRNLTTLIRVTSQFCKEIILVPQVLSKENFKSGNYKWWAPYLPDEAIKPMSDQFNRVMKEVGDKNDVLYAEQLSKSSWSQKEFSDPSHLDAAGNLKFAKLLSQFIRSEENEILNE